MTPTRPALKVISLGWGVQSWALAAMVALGELEPVDFAIHSDTTWEREETYKFAKRWTPWLQDRGVKVITVASEATRGQIKDEWAGTFVPAFTVGPDGSRGQLRRQCTGRWKITPMRRHIASYLNEKGLKKTPGVVEQWLGITLDEWHRAKDSDVRYIHHQFPLLDLRMKRSDCISWLKKNNLGIPEKSSCTFCPYHNKLTWQKMKRQDGLDWKEAVWVDQRIRDERPPYPLFVHDARKPLPEAVVIPEDFGARQLELLDVNDQDISCDSGYCFL